jgi:DNA-binding MarR family transcriptional regulator
MAIVLLELGRAVKRLQNKHHRALDARLVEIGTSLTQFDALRAIKRNPGASAHDLARITFMTDQSFGALATRLAAKRLIARTAGKGRALSHRLTAKGAGVVVRGTAIANEVLKHSFAPLSEGERSQLLDLLLRLLPKTEFRE